MDCDAWRAHGIAQKALEHLRSQRLPFGDQCAMNLALVGRWRELELVWNVQAHVVCPPERSVLDVVWPTSELDTARRAPGIVHFNEGFCGRPWRDCSHPMASLWHAIRAGTEWADWQQPERPVLARARGALRRVRRAVDVVVHG